MDLLTELRTRLDVVSADVPDARLQWCLDVAAEMIDATEPVVAGPLVDEATVQLAVKVYDLGSRGTVSLDPSGEWVAPAPSATRGLINAVAGILAPATAVGMTGGFA